jgi:alpha/beta superfamily hydrolase
MHNKVVYRIAREFQNAGFAVLRFNFRGTGKSEGEHAGGEGEKDDLSSAISLIEGRYSDAEVWVSGFSFGASVMLRASCSDPRVRALIAVGVPASRHDFSQVRGCDKLKLFVQGAEDEFGSPTDLKRFVDSLDEPKELLVIEGAGHFFDGQLDALGRAISNFIVRATPAV